MKGVKSRRAPGNVNNFKPKILGMDAKYAVSLILSLSIAAFLSRYSLMISIAILLASLFFLLPVSNERTGAMIIGSSVGWKFASAFAKINEEYSVMDINGKYFILEGRNIGLSARIVSGNYPAWPESDKDAFQRSISGVLNGLKSSFTLVSLPTVVDPAAYHTQSIGKMAENYNFMVDYLFRGGYYFETYLVFWSRISSRRERASDELLDTMNHVRAGIEGNSLRFEPLLEKKYLEDFLRRLQ